MKWLSIAVSAVLLLMTNSVASATVTYTYTGDPFTALFSATCPSVCRISGYFVLSTPLPVNRPAFVTTINPLSFSFTDGLATVDSANSEPGPFGSTSINIETNSSGAIIGWNNQFFSATNFMFSSTNPPGCIGCSVTDTTGDFANTYAANNQNSPGVWTVTTSVPEPSTWAMLLVGFGGLGAAMRSRRRLTAVTA
jgi:hypothetical protein